MKATLYRLRNYLRKPQNIILLILLLLLSYLVVIPLFTIVNDTLRVHNSETLRIAGSKAGDFTWYHWIKALFSSDSGTNFYTPLLHSLICSLGTCAVAILFGGLFAWLVIRTDLRCKKILSGLFMLPYIMPSWTLALAWQDIFKNELIGGSKGIFTALTGINTANWFAYGPVPIVIVLGLHYSPFAYIFIGGILRNMDSTLEEAALVLKTSRSRMMWSITAPLVLPGILSTVILVFSSAMGSFATSQFLGLPVRYYVLTTEMYKSLTGTNPGYGYAIALIMIVISFAIMMVNQKVIGTRKSYTTVSGKSTTISLFRLKALRTPISAVLLLFVLLITIVPLITFAVESLITVQGDYSLANFSLKYWTEKDLALADGVLVNSEVWLALKNTVILSICCAIGAGTIGCIGGYAVVRRWGSKLSVAVNNLMFIPYLIPSMALSAIFLSMFSAQRGPVPALYGTFLLLVIIGTVKYLPLASRSGINSMFQISHEIEESAVIMGISWRKRMTDILIPIQKSSIISGYLLPTISCMRELELFVLLYTPGSIILTTMLFQYSSKGFDQYSNALTLIIILVVMLLNYLVNKITGASIEKGVGG